MTQVTQEIFIAPALPDFQNRGYDIDYITSVKRRLQSLSNGLKRKKRSKSRHLFPGPQFFRTQIIKNTCATIDTFEVEEGSYKRENNGRISAVLYDILSGKYEYCVYENKSTPAPKLTPMKYDSSYYDKLELLNYLPEHEDTQPEHLYKLAYVRAKRKSKDLWLDSQSKPCFFKAMFKREDQYLNATFLVKVNSFKDLDQDGVKGFSIRVYSLGHIEHELCFFEDGSTQIKRNVHL